MHPTFDVSAVHYKPTKSWKTQIERHDVVQDENAREQAQNFRDEVKISDKYFMNRDDFIEVLSEFRSV